jgi:hypothetical protein
VWEELITQITNYPIKDNRRPARPAFYKLDALRATQPKRPNGSEKGVIEKQTIGNKKSSLEPSAQIN